MPVITNIEDLRALAQKRVPRMFYDYADSGSWTESTYRANSTDFEKIKFRQRVAVNMDNSTLKTTMAGQEVFMPVALAPTGLAGMQHADGEILAAKAAKCSALVLTLDLQVLGQDVIKALALGAKAAYIGRAFLYGLGVMGEAGVTKCLEIIHKELDLTMAFCGVTDVKKIDKNILLPGTC